MLMLIKRMDGSVEERQVTHASIHLNSARIPRLQIAVAIKAGRKRFPSFDVKFSLKTQLHSETW